MFYKAITTILFCCYIFQCNAQMLNGDKQKTLRLNNGISVMVYPSADISSDYYYLPLNIQIATLKNKPEISFLLYKKDPGTSISGGILHLLLKWGLDPQQEKELGQLIRSTIDTAAVLRGGAMIEPFSTGEIKIISGDPLSEALKRSLTQSAPSPVTADQKTAMSFNFSTNDVLIVSDALKNYDKLKKVIFQFRYQFGVTKTNGYIHTLEKKEATAEASFEQLVKDIDLSENLK